MPLAETGLAGQDGVNAPADSVCSAGHPPELPPALASCSAPSRCLHPRTRADRAPEVCRTYSSRLRAAFCHCNCFQSAEVGTKGARPSAPVTQVPWPRSCHLLVLLASPWGSWPTLHWRRPPEWEEAKPWKLVLATCSATASPRHWLLSCTASPSPDSTNTQFDDASAQLFLSCPKPTLVPLSSVILRRTHRTLWIACGQPGSSWQSSRLSPAWLPNASAAETSTRYQPDTSQVPARHQLSLSAAGSSCRCYPEHQFNRGFTQGAATAFATHRHVPTAAPVPRHSPGLKAPRSSTAPCPFSLQRTNSFFSPID